MKKTFISIMTLVLAIALVSCGGNTNGKRKAQELSGAGATFPLPFYNVIFEQFAQVNGDAVAYGGIGSGGGVRNLRDKIVDFAGSDAFLSEKEMKEMDQVVHIPTCMGAVVLAYNLDGVKKLNLSGEVIADIFAGEIKIQKIPYAKIMNSRGELVEPSPSTISAAASGVIPADTRCSITNSDAVGAYPISTFTWIIVYKEQNYSDRSKEQATATLDLLKYFLSSEAQNITSEVHHAPLPTKVKELSMTNLKTITYDGVAILQ